jgi:hypothetical protein
VPALLPAFLKYHSFVGKNLGTCKGAGLFGQMYRKRLALPIEKTLKSGYFKGKNSLFNDSLLPP